MAVSQAQIDQLEAALASGELTVEIDGRRVTYRSTADLRSAIAYFREALAGQAGASVNHSYASFARD